MILLGLGSNLGERKANLEKALRLLGEVAGDAAPALRLRRVSSVYQSAALLPENAPPEWDIAYYNIVVAAETTLPPEALLAEAKRIEREMGREDIGRWGPRLIDIDLLAYEGVEHRSDSLTLPHAAMLERDFVMLPLVEIAPHWRLPDTVAQAGQAMTASEWVRHKGMEQGGGLLRLPLSLQWKAGE